MKNILVMTGSARSNGNTERLADAFIMGAEAAGHKVSKVRTVEYNVTGCIVCNQCYKAGSACIQEDDFDQIAKQIEQADMIVMVTPLYWFSFSAKMKLVIDKFYALLVGQRSVKNKACILIVAGEMESQEVFDGIKATYRRIANYMNWSDQGQLIVTGVSAEGDVSDIELNKAKELGKGA